MRNAMMVGALALAMLTTSGCEAPKPNYPDLAGPVAGTNDLLRRGRAVAAAHAVITTQLALHHLLAAVSQAAATELEGAQPFTVLGSPDPDAEASYALDPATGSGRVDVTRGGRSTMAVTFQYAMAGVADGFRVDVTEAKGVIEGFDFRDEGMSVVFREAAGGWKADVDLRARLASREDDVRTSVAKLSLPGGPIAAGARLGTLAIDVPAHEARFDGTISTASGALVTTGGLDVGGRREYDVRLAGAGDFEIKAVAP